MLSFQKNKKREERGRGRRRCQNGRAMMADVMFAAKKDHKFMLYYCCTWQSPFHVHMKAFVIHKEESNSIPRMALNSSKKHVPVWNDELYWHEIFTIYGQC